MRFTCTHENLLFALNIVSHISTKNPTLPILNNILIKTTTNQVEFSVTNLELALTVTIRAKVDEEGAFTVPARLLGEVVGLHESAQCELVAQAGALEVKTGEGRVIKIKGTPADEYPIIPAFEEGVRISVAPATLREALSQVVFATAKNEIRPELSGVYMAVDEEKKELVCAATDSFRLAEKRVPLTTAAPLKTIIPGRAAFEMMRIIGSGGGEEGVNAELQCAENQCRLTIGEVILISRCIEGRYPDYAQIIPKNFPTNLTVPRDTFTKNIRAASLFATSGMNAVALKAMPDEKQLSVTAANAQVGEYSSVIEVEGSGGENAITLNHRYLLDGLGAIGAEKVFFGLTSMSAPALLRGVDDPSYLYLIMPIKQ